MTRPQAADRFLKVLDGMEYGHFELVTPEGKNYSFAGKNPGPKAQLTLREWSVLPNLLMYGDIGFAETYKAGLWESSNLQNFMTLALQNEKVILPYLHGSMISRMAARFSYLLKSNTPAGSKRNIYTHYDLGNDFYKLWLDPGMSYSSALYTKPEDSLEQAQINKYDRIIDRFDRTSGHMLEIGCGWGAYAERSMARGDFDLKAATISPAQHEYAEKRVGSKAKIILEDYRYLEGKFDQIASIEMFEAVGEKYWGLYFKKIKDLLASGGAAVIQTITIADERFETYRRSGDAIRSFIFPGGMLPSPSRFGEEAAKAGLKVVDRMDFGQDYARTLEVWLHNFEQARPAVQSLGFDDKFIRMWRFYLAACIAGFKTSRTNVMQVELRHAT